MITTDRIVLVRLKIFGQSKAIADDMFQKVQGDLIEVVKHYEKENTEEVQVHLAPDFRCGHCAKLIADCQCGKPNRSPAV